VATPVAAAAAPAKKAPKQLPVPNSDFYQFAETLGADELAILKRARAFMETKVTLRCDCGGQLAIAMQAIAQEGRGLVIYEDKADISEPGYGSASNIKAVRDVRLAA
jgi:hypothetical protein